MEFDWDAGNTGKNLRHGVSDAEIEEAFTDRRAVLAAKLMVGREVRYTLLGRARRSGKYLRIVFTVRMKGRRRLIRPISAVEMSDRNKRRYRRRK